MSRLSQSQMSINDLLNYIQIFELKALVIALIVYTIYFSRRDSFVLAAFLAACLSLVHFGLQALFSKMGTMSYEYQLFAYNAWYITFAITDFALFHVLCSVCDKLGYKLTAGAKLIAYTYIIQGFVQTLRYLDTAILEQNMLSTFYKVAVPTLDSSMILTVCIYVFVVVAYDIKNKKVIA